MTDALYTRTKKRLNAGGRHGAKEDANIPAAPTPAVKAGAIHRGNAPRSAVKDGASTGILVFWACPQESPQQHYRE